MPKGWPRSLFALLRRSVRKSNSGTSPIFFEGRLCLLDVSLVGGEALHVRASLNLLLLPRAAADQPAAKSPK
jgi:hypothetical protein